MTGHYTILLVEDNVDDEQLSVRQLRKIQSPISIEVARDGEEALKRLFDLQQPLPDLVLLDLRLPKVSGLELLQRVRSAPRSASLKVIALSSPDEPAEVRAVHEQLADGFLQKPISIDDFLAIARSLGILRRIAVAL